MYNEVTKSRKAGTKVTRKIRTYTTCPPKWHMLRKFLNTDNQYDNKYCAALWIFIKLNVLKLSEKNYFCGGKNQKLNI